MKSSVDTKNPKAVANEVQELYMDMFQDADGLFVSRSFAWIIDCFSGRFDDYLPIDAQYHNIEHTMQGALCLSRLLSRRHKAAEEPRLAKRDFELCLLAMLFHDTGYLKKKGDEEGTGAKYTLVHVDRSADFCEEFLLKKGLDQAEIRAIQNMIHCTGLNVKPDNIPFSSDTERICGFALGTADLLGQIAADDYVEKLPVLYEEFAECAAFNPDDFPPVRRYDDVQDLMKRTPVFWDNFVLPKIEQDFLGLYRFLSDPYPDGPNDYITRAQANIDLIRRMNDAQ
ncbi:MAG: hypothetical protein K9N52_10205 [Verrucomicrobia bacterium]|nr:hypothetical protein [Verrucomicrobiota bacterium]